MAAAERVATLRQLWPLLAVEKIERSVEFYAEFVARALELEPATIADYGMKQLVVPEPDGYFICFESPIEGWAG